jgi:dipeptidyl aminopeptidase/acylaminoacyl peptidase
LNQLPVLFVEAAMTVSLDTANGERIDSWKEISAYLGRDVSTVIRWEKEKELPVHRIPGGQRQGVFAYRHELDEWMVGLDHSNGAGLYQTSGIGMATGPAAPDGPSAQVTVPTSVELSQSPKVPHWRRALYSAVGFLVALVLISAYRHVNSWFTFGAPQLTAQRQLTANGREKKGLLTDGKTAYFGQEQNGWYALAEMPVDGGPIRVLWNPQANVLPIDISPDGKQLLALCGKGVEEERELWIAPLGAGEPRRLLDITAHSAAWAPDGKTIAYATGTAIYLTSKDQMTPKEAGMFARIPRALNWSQHDQYLRFVLDDVSTSNAVLWGQLSGDDMKTVAMYPLPAALSEGGDWTPVRGTDGYFVWNATQDLGKAQVRLVKYGGRWWNPSIHAAPVPFVQGELNGITFVPEKSRLLALTKPKERTTFVRFDPRLQTFRQILPGASGTFLDYSRDGKWVTYVSYREDALWISQADGSGARQLTYPPEIAELPQWSPDGKRIAYMARRPGSPWRIYILDVETGKARVASEGDDSQGAPTWSPNGRFISYGRVNCEDTHSCAIRRIDLATGKVQTLPDSDGLFTARWSPDGRFIAALHLEQHQSMLFDVKAGKWHKLADGINGTDLDWSTDSKYLYVDFPGEARIVRIRIADGHQETVLDIRTQDSFNLAETEDLQFSVGPDDSLILHRQMHSPEIFAYDMQDR